MHSKIQKFEKYTQKNFDSEAKLLVHLER